MQRQIRYVKTADGVNIAFWTMGKGPPLVYMTGAPWSHTEVWESSECQDWYNKITQNRMLIRFDSRGIGLSDRSVNDLSLEAKFLDIDAVINQLGLDKIDLFASAGDGPIAMAYAAQYPEKVNRLILWCTWKKAESQASKIKAWLSLLEQDWELMTDTCVHLVMGWSDSKTGKLAVEQLRDSITLKDAEQFFNRSNQIDVQKYLPQIQSPTLVLQRTDISWLPVGAAKHLASQIPNAQLTLLNGVSPVPFLGDTELLYNTINNFLDEEIITDSQKQSNPDGLTKREIEVLCLIAKGQTNNEIAQKLFLSLRTVERHIGNIYTKINARGRADATFYAVSHYLI